MKRRTKMALIIGVIAAGTVFLTTGWIDPIAAISLAVIAIIGILGSDRPHSRKQSSDIVAQAAAISTINSSSSDCGSVSGIDAS